MMMEDDGRFCEKDEIWNLKGRIYLANHKTIISNLMNAIDPSLSSSGYDWGLSHCLVIGPDVSLIF